MRTANPDLHLRRRAEIISAAETCFIKRGFHQTSMQNIAEESGLSMGLLYRYFTNKDAIIEAAAAQDQEASLAAISALPNTGNITALWAGMIMDMAAAISAPEYAGLANEILAEANRSPKILAGLRANDAVLVQAIISKLKAQQDAGSINITSNPDSTAHALLIILEGLSMRRFMAPDTSVGIGFLAIENLVSAVLTRALV
jgi:TetR/AcrR family transcriptional regulator, repressor for uid operon